MNRPDSVPARRRLEGRFASRRGLWAAILVSLVALAGCNRSEVRSQKEDETERDRYPVTTVGDVSTFGNAQPMPVTGVGLVENLEGTGSPAPAGTLRQTLEHELRKQRVENVKELLNSSNYSLVLVSGMIPAGARKGDRIDLEITLPQGSKTTSLRGGILRSCQLYNYDLASNISPKFAGSDATVKGHAVVKAEGPVIVGFGDGDETARVQQGRIWQGGVCSIPRPFHLILNAKHQFARVTANVVGRVNTAFLGTAEAAPGVEVAKFQSPAVVLLNPPPQYKHNLPRFLRTVRLVALEDRPTAEDAPAVPYVARLHQDLLDPARTIAAALRLEARGQESVPALRKGLESKDPLVRFCSAEALAYLGSGAGGEELGRVVQQQPYLRLYALTALASLNESVSYRVLKELLMLDLDDDARYGIFRALRTLDERDPDVAGELLNDSFWVHRVAEGTKPLVHVSMSRRAEVVFFGESPQLVPPFSFLAGGFTITAAEEDERCTVTYYPIHAEVAGGSRVRCSLDLGEVIKAMSQQGATYAEVIEMLCQAESCRSLTCRVRNDALPQTVRLEELASAARRGFKDREGNAIEVIKTEEDLGALPTLFQQTAKRKRPAASDAASALKRDPKKDEPTTAERE